MSNAELPKISKKTVDAAKAGPVRGFIWDGKLTGFGLVIQPSGVKSYVYQYRTAEGRSRRLTIGRHGDPWTAEKAREQAEKHARTVADGGDPLGAKQAARKALTVGQLLDVYIESPTFATKAESTRAVDRGRIERHLRPVLGRAIADKVSPDDIKAAFKAIESGATAGTVKTGVRGLARVTGGAGTARMAVRLLRAVYAWGSKEGHVTTNPAAGVDCGADGQREAIIESGDEYGAVFAALQALEDEQEIRPAAADAIRIIALTGARRGEIAGLRWRHVNLRAGVAVLPIDEHKTGKKTKKPRVIGLPAAAREIIERQPKGQPDDFVFRPARGKGAIALNKPWRMARARAGLKREIVLHSLRHSLASHMAMDGAEAAQIMAVMGHRTLTTAQRYVHQVEDKRAAIAEQAAAGVSAALSKARDGGRA